MGFQISSLDQSGVKLMPSPDRPSSQLSSSSANSHPSESSPPPQTQKKFKILQRRPQDGRDSKTQQKPKPTKDEKKQSLDREKEYEKVRKAIFSGQIPVNNTLTDKATRQMSQHEKARRSANNTNSGTSPRKQILRTPQPQPANSYRPDYVSNTQQFPTSFSNTYYDSQQHYARGGHNAPRPRNQTRGPIAQNGYMNYPSNEYDRNIHHYGGRQQYPMQSPPINSLVHGMNGMNINPNFAPRPDPSYDPRDPRQDPDFNRSYNMVRPGYTYHQQPQHMAPYGSYARNAKSYTDEFPALGQ
jgi:hypothetical protein